jgi:hypothetical protein
MTESDREEMTEDDCCHRSYDGVAGQEASSDKNRVSLNCLEICE